MPFVPAHDPDAVALIDAIRAGDVEALRAALAARPELATAHIGDDNAARTCLHIATDWPGGFPRVAETIAVLVAAGADVDATFVGHHTERPLHWAASSGDLAAIDALIDAGADIEAPGAVLTGGGPLDDAIVFDLHDAARRLIERGATSALFHAAALGMTARVRELLDQDETTADQVTSALWHACHHGRRDVAELLVAAGADTSFSGYAGQSTREAAAATGDEALIALVAEAPDAPA